MTSVTTGMSCLSPTSRRIFRPSSPRPWKLYGLVRGLNAPPRRMLAPAALTWPAIVVEDPRRSRRRTGPAIMASAPPPILHLADRATTVSVGVKFPAGQLERLEDRQHLLDAGDGRQRLGLQLVLVADDADDGAQLALAEVRLEAQLAGCAPGCGRSAPSWSSGRRTIIMVLVLSREDASRARHGNDLPFPLSRFASCSSADHRDRERAQDRQFLAVLLRGA